MSDGFWTDEETKAAFDEAAEIIGAEGMKKAMEAVTYWHDNPYDGPIDVWLDDEVRGE